MERLHRERDEPYAYLYIKELWGGVWCVTKSFAVRRIESERETRFVRTYRHKRGQRRDIDKEKPLARE